GRGGCAGLSGAAAGLCNAYCNAQNCPNNPKPSCESLRKNFAKHTGRSTFPCDVIVPGPTQTPVATTTAAVSTVTATAAAPTTTAAAPTATVTAAGATTTAAAP